MNTTAATSSTGCEFRVLCPQCNVEQPGLCGREDVLSDQPVKVHGFTCDHSWYLSAEQKQSLRKELDAGMI